MDFNGIATQMREFTIHFFERALEKQWRGQSRPSPPIRTLRDGRPQRETAARLFYAQGSTAGKSADVCYRHLADIPGSAINVRFRGWSGHDKMRGWGRK